MIHPTLIHPKSIVVVGGSNDISKPGGKVLDNILRGQYQGHLSVLNPKEKSVQGVSAHAAIQELPDVDLAIIAIPARYVSDTVRQLIQTKGTKSFIVLSAGFGEESEAGKKLEEELCAIVSSAGACLIGPNCVGVLTPDYHGVFTSPIPKLDPTGCDFVSGSGSTACFIMEIGIPMGLTFASLFSVGNSAQIGIEEVLQYFDETFNPETSSRVKLVYAEKIEKPAQFLKHASSLAQKGCRIAAIKAGTSGAGMRAASSHTGALASSDMAVDALFGKAGVVRCYSKEELANVAGIFMHPIPRGKNVAVITNAGGPGVMATDTLTQSGLNVPLLPDRGLLAKLHPGSSAANPIDFLATGTADQFRITLEHVDREVDEIDAMIAIFGTPGMMRTFDSHRVLLGSMKSAHKPIYAVLPSPATADEEQKEFLEGGGIFFRDEVALAQALGKVLNTALCDREIVNEILIDARRARDVVKKDGYLQPAEVGEILDACGIARAVEGEANTVSQAISLAESIYPVVMKVIGPLHKSDVGGVCLGVRDKSEVKQEFERMMTIPEATGVLVQEMASGVELFAGVKYEPGFGHLILCGLGGIFVEALKDVQAGLSPISAKESRRMIRNLRSAKLFREFRNQRFVDEEKYSDILRRLSALVAAVPAIREMDLNPLIANGDRIIAVDARIRISIEDH